MSDFSFAKKNVLLTGASGGLGSAIARRLAEMDANMVVSSRSDKALQELIESLPKKVHVFPITADLSKPGDAENLAQNALEALGTIDVLFNIAGTGYFALMEEATEANIRYLFELNTFSPLILIKKITPHMKARGSGRIINIVSCAGRVPIPTVGVYGGSKSALATMANTMRLELAPSGVDIINIYPGTMSTSFEENALREEKRPGLCPTDSCGLPRFEIADKILTAASGAAQEVWLERQGKWLSAAAIVWPKFVERLITPVRDKALKSKSFKKRRWRLLQVESSLACNLRCIMCPWRQTRDDTKASRHMSQEVWDVIRPYLPDISSVDFTGGGEPLLQPRLVEWIADAKSAGCETGILTNGMLLNQEMAQKIVQAGIDWVCVSMDGATRLTYEQIRKGANFIAVCENITSLANQRQNNSPKLMINFVLMNINMHEVEEIVRLAAQMGVDQVNFKQCDVIRGEQGKEYGLFDIKVTKEIRQFQKSLKKALKLAKKLGLQTTAFSFLPEELAVCAQDPRNSLFIRYDGSVAPCINLAIGGTTTFLGTEKTIPTVHYGRLPEQDLLELWESDTCQFYRNRFQQRVEKQQQAVMNSFVKSQTSREKILKAAQKAMPEAPEGCRVCHYLYDI